MEGLNSGVLRKIQLLIRAGTEHTLSRLQFQCSWTLCLHSFFTVQTLSAFLLDKVFTFFFTFLKVVDNYFHGLYDTQSKSMMFLTWICALSSNP